MVTALIWVTVFIFLFNIPFGYWRINVKKFSLQWILAVHIPVPFIIALRFMTPIGFAWYTYIFLVGAFFLGQRTGAVIHKRRTVKNKNISSCLVMDLFRASKI
ncbi:MAG TPA: hypothetical protein ENH02_06125 [Bacteroidetes bacterium]|nr:hypothetical protein [Bacteroidota bacterium]